MIFNSSHFHTANGITNTLEFNWSYHSQKAKITFSRPEKNPQLAISLPMTPYAGLELSESILPTQVPFFISGMIDFLKNEGITSCIIKQAPVFYHSSANHIHQELYRLGAQVNSEINHHILLKKPLDNISSMQMRRIRKCINSNLTFQEEDTSQIQNIYDFLVRCRRQQGLEVNIDPYKFERLLKQFPSIFKIYSVKSPDSQLMAVLVTIEVNEKVVYSYLPAFDRQFSNFSPLAFLYHQYLQIASKTYQTLDLGISSIHGKPQSGLINFKEGMGGIRSDRFVYQIKF